MFIRKKQNSIVINANKEFDESNSSLVNDNKIVIVDTKHDEVNDDEMAKDLGKLVGDAITVWANKYGLQNLPRDIILDQAISMMLTVRKYMK